MHTAATIAREEGLAKLWSGATATTIRQASLRGAPHACNAGTCGDTDLAVQGSNQMSLFWGKAVADTLFWDKHVGWLACAAARVCSHRGRSPTDRM